MPCFLSPYINQYQEILLPKMYFQQAYHTLFKTQYVSNILGSGASMNIAGHVVFVIKGCWLFKHMTFFSKFTLYQLVISLSQAYQ